jgi:hypothetical protein
MADGVRQRVTPAEDVAAGSLAPLTLREREVAQLDAR